MSFQSNQGEAASLVGHEIPGADGGTQVVQLTQIQIAQIVSNVVSQVLTHQMQQIGNSPPSATVANHVTQNATAAQQFQTSIKFDVPAFKGDSTASWLTWSQRVLYQARASEDELTAAEGDGLSVGADVSDSSNVDPVRLRNAHVAWMTLINICSGMALEIVQRNNAPNDAWRNIESHCRAKGTREILLLSHEINGKTMEPGGDPFKFMMEIDRLAADLHRLGDKSVTELRKCVIIVSDLSADFEMECRMLENNPAGLNRADIERVVGNQYNKLRRQQHDSKALSASKGIVTANRGKGKNRKLHHKFDGNCFNCGKKGHRAGDCRSAKKSEKSGAADDKKEGGGSGRCYICGSEEHFAHRHCGLCKSFEHWTRDCEERGAEKGAMLAKLTVSAVSEVRAVAAIVGAARGDRKEKCESDSGATFHMSHTRAGMSAYKKASPGTNVEIVDGNILPVDGFGRIEVDWDQPDHTTKMVKMDDVAYVPGLSRNLLSTIKAVEQWGKPLIYSRDKAVLGFPEEESLVFKFCPRKGLFSATGARPIPRQEVALGENLAENGLVRIASGTALAMRAEVSRDVMEVDRMLAHPSEDITRKTAEMVEIETTSQWGTGARRILRQEVALGENLTENGLVRIASGTALAVRAGVSRDVTEAHRMLAHPSEDITRKTAEMVGIETTGQWRACETCFQAKAKRHAVPKKTDERASVRTMKIVERQAAQWVDGPKNTGGDSTGSGDRGTKIGGRWNHCRERDSAAQCSGAGTGTAVDAARAQDAGGVFRTRRGDAGGVLKTRGGDAGGVIESRRGDAGGAFGTRVGAAAKGGGSGTCIGVGELERPALPALRKLTIDGNIPPILSSRTRSQRPQTGVEGAALHCFLPTIEAEEENGVKDALACDDGSQMAMQATPDIPEPRNRRQAMESPEWDEWRKAEETKMLGMVENCVYKQVARSKDELVVGTKILYKRKIGQNGKVEKYKCRLVAQGF